MAPHVQDQTSTPEQILQAHFGPEELAIAVDMYKESLDMPDAAREQHRQGVQELLGGVALYEALQAHVDKELDQARQLQSEFWADKIAGAPGKIEKFGFAKQAPSFSEQIADSSRTTRFAHGHQVQMGHDLYVDDQRDATEQEGLQELSGFLQRFLQETRTEDGGFVDESLAAQAKSMLEGLTFVGAKEYEEASRGLAAYWKAYLDADPDNQICVLAKISNSEKYPGVRKSDDYLQDRVLQTFTDSELQKYSGRIVSDLDDISARSNKVKVVLLDDYIISGSQLKRDFAYLSQDHRFVKYVNNHRVEVNLMVASKDNLHYGLYADSEYGPKHVPIKAYYRANTTEAAEHNIHVTSIYSSANFDFAHPINHGMQEVLNKMGNNRSANRNLGLQGKRSAHVALANIVPPYRTKSSGTLITAKRLVRL